MIQYTWCDPVHIVLVWSTALCFGVIQYILFWCDPVHLVWPSTLCFHEFDVCREGKDHCKPRWHTTLLSLCRKICLLGHRLHKTFNIFTIKHQQFNKTLLLNYKSTIHTHTCNSVHTQTHTLFFWLTNHLKHSLNMKTKFLKHQNTQIYHKINR